VSRFATYNPHQAWLLPPSIEDELDQNHIVFFLHETVERLDLSQFEAEYAEQGRPAYPPQLLLKVWL
jgi:transposase